MTARSASANQDHRSGDDAIGRVLDGVFLQGGDVLPWAFGSVAFVFAAAATLRNHPMVLDCAVAVRSDASLSLCASPPESVFDPASFGKAEQSSVAAGADMRSTSPMDVSLYFTSSAEGSKRSPARVSHGLTTSGKNDIS
jgi:hypothetical protein